MEIRDHDAHESALSSPSALDLVTGILDFMAVEVTEDNYMFLAWHKSAYVKLTLYFCITSSRLGVDLVDDYSDLLQVHSTWQ